MPAALSCSTWLASASSYSASSKGGQVWPSSHPPIREGLSVGPLELSGAALGPWRGVRSLVRLHLDMSPLSVLIRFEPEGAGLGPRWSPGSWYSGVAL